MYTFLLVLFVFFFYQDVHVQNKPENKTMKNRNVEIEHAVVDLGQSAKIRSIRTYTLNRI